MLTTTILTYFVHCFNILLILTGFYGITKRYLLKKSFFDLLLLISSLTAGLYIISLLPSTYCETSIIDTDICPIQAHATIFLLRGIFVDIALVLFAVNSILR